MEPFKDLLMEGLSAKLKTFEDVSNNYLINMEPRINYMGARMEHNKEKQDMAQKNLGLLKSNLLNKIPNLQNQIQNQQQAQQQQFQNPQFYGPPPVPYYNPPAPLNSSLPNQNQNMNLNQISNNDLSKMAQNIFQKSMGSSNSNPSTKNLNNFRVQRVNNNMKRGGGGLNNMNNIFDGNKLAGSSTFNGLGNTQSKLGQNSNYFENLPMNNNNPLMNFANQAQNNQYPIQGGFQGGYNTAPNMGEHLVNPYETLDFNNLDNIKFNNMQHLNNMNNYPYHEPNDIDHEADDEIEFRYNHDFDENGAIFWLGSNGKTANFKDPYTLGKIKVVFSSIGKGRYEDFVSRALTNCRTMNEPNAFIGIDFGPDKSLIPSCYTIKNRDSTRHVLLNWIFEVRN